MCEFVYIFTLFLLTLGTLSRKQIILGKKPHKNKNTYLNPILYNIKCFQVKCSVINIVSVEPGSVIKSEHLMLLGA